MMNGTISPYGYVLLWKLEIFENIFMIYVGIVKKILIFDISISFEDFHADIQCVAYKININKENDITRICIFSVLFYRTLLIIIVIILLPKRQ